MPSTATRHADRRKPTKLHPVEAFDVGLRLGDEATDMGMAKIEKDVEAVKEQPILNGAIKSLTLKVLP